MSEKVELTKEQKDAKKRAVLFVPCTSKKQLHNWIKLFLGLDIPDCIVDPESTSCPMDMIYECYSKMLENNDPTFNRMLAYASRDGFKTISASILELLTVFHLGRDVAHMAAIEAQSRKSQLYVKKFLSRPILRDYLIGDSQEETWIVRYNDPETGLNITENEYKKLANEDKDKYIEIRNYIKVVICTLAGSNSDHVPFFCVGPETKILEKKTGSHQRLRKMATARGLFRRLSGINNGGRPGASDNKPGVIEQPAEKIEILSLNHVTGFWEFSPIVRAQSSIRPRVRLTTASGASLVCTDDHPIYALGRGYMMVNELAVGDKVVRVFKSKTARKTVHGFNGKSTIREEYKPQADAPEVDYFDQILLGSLLGDCGIYRVNTSNAYIREQHCMEQAGYLAWKRGYITQKVRTSSMKNPRSGYTGALQTGFFSGNSPILTKYAKVRTDLTEVERLGPLGLAVWFMDDGCNNNGLRFSTECFTETQNEYLKKLLKKNFDIDVEVKHYEREGRLLYYIQGGVSEKRKLVEICKPYIHPDLAYKFDVSGNKQNCRVCDREYWNIDRGSRAALDCGDVICRLIVNETLKVDTITDITNIGEGIVYDFTLENNHNYISDSFLSHNCVDEVDVVTNPRAYEEAKMIPAPINGLMPLTLLTSTRKISTGLVQKEIDEAVDQDGETRLHIRHWNLIDVTQACPPERHLPDEPKIPIYVNDDELRAISEEKYKALNSENQVNFKKEEGYAGCLSRCKLYAACHGRLATLQTSKSPLLKPIDHTINQFRTVSLPTAQAQLLCRKPSKEGMIYPNLDRSVHMLTASQMAEMIVGIKFPANMSKVELIALMKTRDLLWYSGMDFGFSHNFAVTTGAVDGYRAFIVDVISQAELMPDEQIRACDNQIKHLNPAIFADPENPQMIKTFRAAGYRMREWNKGPGSLLGGIDIVRMRLRPPLGEPLLFFLAGDSNVELLFKKLEKHHWKVDATGKITDKPEDKGKDEPDSLRYFIMNVFGTKSKVRTATEGGSNNPSSTIEGTASKENWMQKWLLDNGITSTGDNTLSVTKGRFKCVI